MSMVIFGNGGDAGNDAIHGGDGNDAYMEDYDKGGGVCYVYYLDDDAIILSMVV